MDQCLNIEAETVIRPMDELFFPLKHTWLGNMSSLWHKPAQFPVDILFEPEWQLNRHVSPLFDIIRLIQFSRSPLTKQCIRCANYTEASTSVTATVTGGINPAANSSNSTTTSSNSKQNVIASETLATLKTNCIYMQDSSSEKCLCGGYWVLSTSQ